MPTVRKKPQGTSGKVELESIGYSGLKMFNGVSTEEVIKELNHPRSTKTFREMSYHPAINTPLSLYQHMVAKATFRVNPVKDATSREKKQAEIEVTKHNLIALLDQGESE